MGIRLILEKDEELYERVADSGGCPMCCFVDEDCTNFCAGSQCRAGTQVLALPPGSYTIWRKIT